MGQQVVGLFREERGLFEAAQMMRDAGYPPLALDLASKGPVPHPALLSLVRHVHLGRLTERPERMWPYALRCALIASILVEIVVLVWVLLYFDSWGTQALLSLTIWKFGALFGGMLGAIIGADRGLESNMVRLYERHLSEGALALAARVRSRDAPNARGIFLETGAYDIRNVEGNFIAAERPVGQEAIPEKQDNAPAH